MRHDLNFFPFTSAGLSLSDSLVGRPCEAYKLLREQYYAPEFSTSCYISPSTARDFASRSSTPHRLQPESSHLGRPHLTVYSQSVRISIVRTSQSTARVFASRLSAPHSPQPESSHLDRPHLTVHSQRVVSL